jgi:hypothetical protein
VYEGILLRLRRDPTFRMDPEDLYRWSCRWMQAAREGATTKDERVAAVADHLARMQKWQQAVAAGQAQGLWSPLDLAAAEFYHLEAQAWFEQEKAP